MIWGLSFSASPLFPLRTERETWLLYHQATFAVTHLRKIIIEQRCISLRI